MPKVKKTGLPKSKRKVQRAKRKLNERVVDFPSIYIKPTGSIDKMVIHPKKKRRKRKAGIKI